MPHKSWTLLRGRAISNHRIFRIRYDDYRFEPSGSERDFVVLECPDWVNVVPVTDDGRIVLVRQYRHGIQKTALELPGGVIDDGESPEGAALRELAKRPVMFQKPSSHSAACIPIRPSKEIGATATWPKVAAPRRK
jgi:hypothetical protein